MDDSQVIQLLTLWFVVLIYIQTGSGGSGPVITAIGVFAILLAYVIPLTILALLIVQTIKE